MGCAQAKSKPPQPASQPLGSNPSAVVPPQIQSQNVVNSSITNK